MADMKEIEAQTKKYAERRAELATLVQALEDEKRDLVKRRIEGIKRKISQTIVEREALHVLLGESPALFVKPRTVEFHGVRVGFKKGAGKIEIEDESRTVELIRKHRTEEEFDVLVKTVYKPVKDALANLPAGELKKLGVTVEDTGDVVLIKDAAGAVDKLVKALLKEEPDEAGA